MAFIAKFLYGKEFMTSSASLVLNTSTTVLEKSYTWKVVSRVFKGCTIPAKKVLPIFKGATNFL